MKKNEDPGLQATILYETVYCFKLYDKKIILNIPGIGNKWRERLLEEEDH